MHVLKNFLYKAAVLIAVSSFLISCSSLNPFKSTAGKTEDSGPENERLAELETQVLDLKQEQADLKFMMEKKEDKIAELEKKISILEKRAPGKKPVQYKIEYTSPSDLYKKARNLLLEEDYANAAALFETFIKNHPKDSLADNAMYWLGECYYTQGEYKKAIAVFERLETLYPKSEKVADAILKTGYSHLSLDDSNRAHHHLKRVLKKYPFSPAAEKAQEKLRSFE